jgi:hypothetical protein
VTCDCRARRFEDDPCSFRATAAVPKGRRDFLREKWSLEHVLRCENESEKESENENKVKMKVKMSEKNE